MVEDGLALGVGPAAAKMVRDGLGYHGRGIAVPCLLGWAQRWICAIDCEKRITHQLSRENRARCPGREYLDHRHLVAVDIDRRLLILDLDAQSPKPSIDRVRGTEILLCPEDSKC